MKPGPKPKPASVKVRAGITAPSDVNLNEPLPSMEPPDDPVTPDDPADAAAWARAHEITREVMRLQHPGLITKLDDGLLESYALVRAKREDLGRLLAKTGIVIRGRRAGELVRNPVYIGFRDSVMLEGRLGAELGIGPSARAAIRMQAGDGLDLPDIGPAPRFTAIAGGKP